MLSYIKRHYHWLIALLVFLEMIVYGGLVNSASVFVNPISQGLGVSTTSYALAMMPYTITCFLGTCLSGYLFSRFGYKKVAMVSLAVVAISLVLTAISQNLLIFSISKILFGAGFGACFTAGAVRIVKDWFRKHQGLVLGAVSMATGLGGSLMTLVLSGVIQRSGWRAANLTAAGIIAIVFLLYWLIKDRPQEMQLEPYGAQAEIIAKKRRQEQKDWPGLPMQQLLRRPSFYLMCLCVVVSCVCLYTTSSYVVPHFHSQGYSQDQAALYQSVYMLALALVKLLLGYLYDRFGSLPLVIGCMLCAAAGQGILGLTNDPTLCMIAILLFSAGLCMSSIMIPLIAAPVFGSQTSQSVNGIFLGLSSLCILFSNPISSLCYDATGVYTPVYRVVAIVDVVVLGLYLVLFRLGKRDKQHWLKSKEL